MQEKLQSQSTLANEPPVPPSSLQTDPSTQFSMLQSYAQEGILSAQELVQLAPTVFAGTDPSLLPSIQAILPLRECNQTEFESAFNMILSQRGINRVEIVNAEIVSTEPAQTEATGASTIEDVARAVATEEGNGFVKEIVVIAIDVSGSMESPFEVDDDVRTVDRTRLQAVKQCFYGFRDQTQAHENGSHHLLGLISFSDKVAVHTYPTANLDVFEDVIDDMSSSGRTAIFEAISVACTQMLAPVARQHPKADLRVLVLSDGLNNCNTVSANAALQALAEVGAVCDCMILGDKSSNADEGLRRLVAASEGQCVQFTGLSDAYEALESPAMISLSSRRNGDTAFDREAFQARMKALKKIDTVQVAPLKRGFVQAAKAPTPTAVPIHAYVPLSNIPSSFVGVGGVGKRLLKEMNDYAQNPLPNLFIYPGVTEKNQLSEELKVLMVGSGDHPLYKDGIFELKVRVPSKYPFAPPQVQFTTPIYHYAISAEGKACLPILHDGWSPAKSIRECLEDLSDLVHDYKKLDPDCNLALRSWLSDLLRTDPGAYNAEAVRHTADNAKKAPKDLQLDKYEEATDLLLGIL